MTDAPGPHQLLHTSSDMHEVSFRRVCVCACACVCACVRACVRAHVRARVCACMGGEHIAMPVRCIPSPALCCPSPAHRCAGRGEAQQQAAQGRAGTHTCCP